MAQTKLPWEIENIVRGKNHTVNTTGMSGAQVWMYEDMVLKIQPCMPWVRRELTMLQWLSGRLPVPRLIAHQELKGKSYCLMTRIRGKMACDSQFLDNPELLTARLAEAMQMLWSVDTSACPVCRSQELELKKAAWISRLSSRKPLAPADSQTQKRCWFGLRKTVRLMILFYHTAIFACRIFF